MIKSVIWSVPAAALLAYVPISVRAFLVSRHGKFNNKRRRDYAAETANMPKHLQELALRLKGSHENQLEMLGLYAGAVAIGVATRVPAPELARLTSWYIKCRIGYNLAYAAPQVGNGVLRSLTFFASMTSCILIYSAAAKAVTASV